MGTVIAGAVIAGAVTRQGSLLWETVTVTTEIVGTIGLTVGATIW